MQGKCSEWDENKGYGTIMGEDGKRYFSHFSHIQSTDISLDVGESVTFEPVLCKDRGNMAVLVVRNSG